MALQGIDCLCIFFLPLWCMKKAQRVVSGPCMFPSSLQTCLDFNDNRSFLTIARAFLFMGSVYQNLLVAESRKRSSTPLRGLMGW